MLPPYISKIFYEEYEVLHEVLEKFQIHRYNIFIRNRSTNINTIIQEYIKYILIIIYTTIKINIENNQRTLFFLYYKCYSEYLLLYRSYRCINI